jgi:nucleoid-associated protein YgaU
MTRENKLALVIGFGLMLFVGILVSDHFSAQRFDPATVAEAEPKTAETEPVQLDAVGGDALVAGAIDLGKDGTSTLPDAPAPGEVVLGDPAATQVGLPVEVAKADGTPVKFHKVQKGETYWSIAAREYGDGSLATKLQDYNKAVSPDAAKLALNADLRIPPIDVLKPGAVAKSAAQAGTSVARATPEPKAAARVAATVTVGKGDTAYGIAQKQGVKVAELLKHNGIKDPAALKPGQTLKIPTKG